MKTSAMRLITMAMAVATGANAFSPPFSKQRRSLRLRASWETSQDALDSNTWEGVEVSDDWEDILAKKKDGSFWSDFEVEQDGPTTTTDSTERQLDILRSLQAEEVEFNRREAERADMARQMQEWGFESSTIASTLNVAVAEPKEEVRGMQDYREESYLDAEDLTMIESHTKVPKDPDTDDPLRSQMVYVDEHSCIGCTNCAMIAQSTFFMEEENGRARVFEQWGDDEETIQIAVDTCPVDCIHYVSYDELVQLEVKRRDQSINVLAGLVSRAERGAGSGISTSLSPRSFGNQVFSNAPKIRGNYGPNDDVFQSKEKLRLQKAAIKRLEHRRRRENKIVDL